MPAALLLAARNKALESVLEDLGIVAAGDGARTIDAAIIVAAYSADLVGDPAFEAARLANPNAAVLLAAPADDLEAATTASRAIGADVLTLPVDHRRATEAVRRALSRHEERARLGALVDRVRALDPSLGGEVAALAREAESRRRDLEEAARLRSFFIANISHEVRTPVTVMQGMIDILRDDLEGRLSEDQLDVFDRIGQSSESLLEIVQSILDLSKAEAGVLEIRPTRIYFPDFVNELVRGVEEEARKKNLRLRVEVPREIEWLSVDAVRLRQVLAGLLSNAVKFTEEGNVRFAARLVGRSAAPDPGNLLRAAVQSGDTLEITIADTGPGISQADQQRIFEAFQQVDVSSTRQHEGLGIGLAVVRQMTKLLGASVDLSSVPGAGTTFRLRLPVVPAEEPTGGVRPVASAKARAPRIRDSRGALPELARLALTEPASADDAVSFALDAVAALLGAEVVFVAKRDGDAWVIADAIRHVASDVVPGSPLPVAADVAATALRERRGVRADAGGGRSWTLVADPGEPLVLGVLQPKRDEAAEDDLRIVQIVGRWLALERVRSELLQERGEIVAAIGRDVKSPLGSLLAYTQTLLRGLHGPLPEVHRDVVLRLERALHRTILSALDLLDYGRVRSGRLDLRRDPFRFEAVIDHVLQRQAAGIELGRHTVRKEVPPGLPECLGDEIRTDRAVANVLRALLERIAEGAELGIRLAAAPDGVACEISADIEEASQFVETFRSLGGRISILETLGLRLAATWIETQDGRVDVEEAGGRVTIRLTLPTR